MRDFGFNLSHVSLVLCLTAMMASGAFAQWTAEQDQEYIKRFQVMFPPIDSLPDLDAYAAIARYDETFLESKLEAGIVKMPTDSSSLAWGWSYHMMSLNEMYRATGDLKYLRANLRVIRAVIDRRDDRQGVALWTGKTATAWGSNLYSGRGRCVFAVHTGMITYPMFDFLALAGSNPEFKKELGAESSTIRTIAGEAIAWHDRQWREGPEAGEGHYIGMDQEPVLEGIPLPGNRLSAMGRAMWTSWKLSGNTVHRDRALDIGRYIKHRLSKGEDGALYWPYALPVKPATETVRKEAIAAEDVSHGILTMSLPIMLAADGQVFSKEDMIRLGKTVKLGFGRLGGGVLLPNVNGNPGSGPGNIQSTARWLALTPFAPDTYGIISQFYLRNIPEPSPLDLALLIQHRPKEAVTSTEP